MNNLILHPGVGVEELDAVYDALKSETKSKRSEQSLKIVRDICEDISKGNRDFKYEIIGDLSKSNGGPSAQAIRNKNGERYQILIDAYTRAYPKPIAPEKVKTKSWVERITEPDIRWMAKEVIRENKLLKTENDMLRRAMRSDSGPLLQIGGSGTTPKSASTLPNLNAAELAALQDAIDPQSLKRAGLSIGDSGEVRDENNHRLLPRGFVSAIEKILTVSQN
ncbi:gamma-mobile-trio protein GmtX [Photobacterium alginatilyticum]|uniref:Uncharacterized protein n=1 Tax=Photobacterium alginatilyticum TaxID=1775171 RepID=A0ABW9YLQ0_9GAMM|nr:gamma-mobile-trio protein GmtX [Photobacterium alginatilyticum]NBI54186.1 hypothetical protein [Photobacterium alginatilyticum]